ncbi:DinB family protein [Oceanobacillus manasiensis]|uniref:DinB family protein n=1 Tax=Oceanobacillus manasiensis TaxID=586413 RepID=UPI0005A76A65|nr:DinB family protein [Oceanobacillus manasiensis]
MQQLFKYNWQVRDEWFTWCEQLTIEELSKKRTGGAGSILYTLFHIIDVEYSWIRAIQGKEDIEFPFDDYKSIKGLRKLSDTLRIELESFLENIEEIDMAAQVKASWLEDTYRAEEIIPHVIVHEIHHIGQLSIWARELNKKPISANLIGRGL